MNIAKYYRYVTKIFLLFFGIDGVFAEVNTKSNSLSTIFSTENFQKYFGPESIEWFNWVIYFALIIGLTFIIKEVGLKNIKIKNRAKSLIAMLISFMAITGFMWVLIANNRAPSYLAYFMAEIFILVIAALIVKSGFVKEGEKFAKPLAFRVFVIFLAFILINGFHSLLLSENVNLNGLAIDKADRNLLLVDIAQTLSFKIPLILYIIIYLLVIYFFAGDSDEKLDPEEKERSKKVKEYKKLLGLLGKNVKEAENLMSEMSGMLKSHLEGRR